MTNPVEGNEPEDGLRVAVLGATGRMGRLVVEEVGRVPGARIVAEVARSATPPHPGCFHDAHVVIDFSLPDALRQALPFVGSAALVSGTTGLDSPLRRALADQAERGPVLWAANFSLGIHVLRALARQAAQWLPHADLEVVEVHHRHKVDSPSGTARALADDLRESRALPLEALRSGRDGAVGPRRADEVGVHAIRGGDVAGEHTVHLLMDGERLWLGHAASGRATFASGAVRVAQWIAGREPGTYTLADVVEPSP